MNFENAIPPQELPKEEKPFDWSTFVFTPSEPLLNKRYDKRQQYEDRMRALGATITGNGKAKCRSGHDVTNVNVERVLAGYKLCTQCLPQ